MCLLEHRRISELVFALLIRQDCTPKTTPYTSILVIKTTKLDESIKNGTGSQLKPEC